MQANASIEEALRRKQAILDASLDAIISMDASGTVVDFNHAAERIFGYPSSQAIGQPLCELIVPPDLRAAHLTGLRRYLETGQAQVIGKRLEIRAMHADGHEFAVELSITVIADQTPMFTATLRDITEQKAAELELRNAQTALLLADRRKNEFLATLAHELRNPLAPIRNGLQIARLSARSDDRLQRTLNMMDRQLKHLVHLVDDLLDVGRLSAGKLRIRVARVSMHDVIASSLEATQALFEQREIRLQVNAPPGEMLVTGDFDRLTQVVSNLLSNAAKYTPGGGWARIDASSHGDRAVVSVSDSGIGISPEDLPRVFDLFSQVREQQGHAEGGLGIGLALVRQFMTMHGGTAEARSEGLGRGATFEISLPLLS